LCERDKGPQEKGETHMNKIERAKARVEKARQAWVKAVMGMNDTIEAENAKADARTSAIEAKAKQRIAALDTVARQEIAIVKQERDTVITPEVIRQQRAAVLGLAAA